MRQQSAVRRARRLETLTLAARLSIFTVLGLTLGSSSAVQAIWIKNAFTLIPPAAFLLAERLERREPDARFPYGLYRITSLVHLTTALTLLALGVFLLGSALGNLWNGRAPELGRPSWGGLRSWEGWPLLAALAYAAALPPVLSHFRVPLSLRLHDKALYADSLLGRAEWHASTVAGLGLVGVGLGYWWADYAAAALVGVQILGYGIANMSEALRDLLDERPRLVGGEDDPLPGRVREWLEELPWIDAADVTLRETGRLITGRAYVHVNDTRDLPRRIRRAAEGVQALDWRIYGFAIVPVENPESVRP